MSVKKTLTERMNSKISAVEALLADETRDVTEDVAKCMSEIDNIKSRIDTLASLAEKRQDEEDFEEEDNEKDDPANVDRSVHPSIIRSRGARSEPDNINLHATKQRWSLTRAALAVGEGRALKGLEREVHDELSRSTHCAGNFLMPMGDMSVFEKRNYETRDLTLSTGVGAIPTLWNPDEFISYLYPVMYGPKLGIKIMHGVNNVTRLPRQTTPAIVAAVAEESAASASSLNLDDVTLTPISYSGNVTLSHKFMTQSIIAADRYAMESLGQQIAVKLDSVTINGTGSTESYGLLNNSAFTQFIYAGSNTLAYSNLVTMQRTVYAANAGFGNLGWLTSPGTYAALQSTPKISGYPDFLVSPQGQVLGETCVRTSQVPANLSYSGTSNLSAIIYGAWQFLVLALFGNGMSVVVDPFTGSTSGNVTITAIIDADTNLLHPGAFAAIVNANVV